MLLAAAMIEPHMALPACVAAFLLLPRTRVMLILCGVVALGFGLLGVGPHVFLTYFTQALPVHALSELDNLGQDSLTTILHHLGVADALAVRLGEIQYALMSLVGIFLGWRLTKTDGDRAWIVLMPAACAMIGGSFVHLSEVAMAIPAAALLVVRRGGWCWLPLMMLALPWEALINYGIFFIPGGFVASLLLREFGAPRRYIVSIGVLVAALSIIGHAAAVTQIGTTNGIIADPGPSALASVSWGEWNRLSFIGPAWWIEKTLTLTPLVLLVYYAIQVAFPDGLRVPIFRRKNDLVKLSVVTPETSATSAKPPTLLCSRFADRERLQP
jgi:hypothetical protein